MGLAVTGRDRQESAPPPSPSYHGVPRIAPGTIPRDRLTRQLDEPSWLTVVRGIPGGGKTVAVAQWVRSQPVNCVWITVDSTCVTRTAFWRRTFLQLAAVLDESGSLTATAAARSLSDSDDVRGIITCLAENHPSEVVVVVDNYHLLAFPEADGDLLTLLRATSRLRLVVLARTLTGLEDPALALELERHLVPPSDLLFTRAETAAALAGSGLDVADPMVSSLHEAIGGIPAVVRAVTRQAQSRGTEALNTIVTHELAEGVARYLHESVSSDVVEAPALRFALRVSVAEELPVALAATLGQVELEAAHDALDEMERLGLGTWIEYPSTSQHYIFAITPIVRSALRTELSERHPAEVRDLRLALARWSMDAGDYHTALIHAVEVGEYDLASVIVRHGLSELVHNELRATRALLSSIPFVQLRKHPLLTMLLALMHNAQESQSVWAAGLFLVALDSVRSRTRRGVDPSELLILTVVESAAMRLTGRHGGALRAAARATELYRGMSDRTAAELRDVLARLLLHIGITYLHAGLLDVATAHFQESAAQAGPGSQEHYSAQSALASAIALRGDMPGARAVLADRQDDHLPSQIRSGYVGTPRVLARALCALEEFDVDGADAIIHELDPHIRTLEHWPLAVPVQAFVDAARGTPHAALARLDATLAAPGTPAVSPQGMAGIDAVRVLLHVAAGGTGAALRGLRQVPEDSAIGSVAHAIIALLTGDAVRALTLAQRFSRSYREQRMRYDHLDRSRRYSHENEQSPDLRVQATSALVGAAAALRLGRLETARAYADEAATLLGRHALRTPLALITLGDRSALAELVSVSHPALAGTLLASLPVSLVPERLERVEISAREQVLLSHLARGLPLPSIAERLVVSVNTLKKQRASLYRKLGASTRAEAIVKGAESGLLDDVPLDREPREP